jgi:ureidoglycolate lyase
MKVVPLEQNLSAQEFAPFGGFIDWPSLAGERRFYSDWLGTARPDCAPVLHTNRISPSQCPVVLDSLENHPHAAQVFIPLDVSRYLVIVAPSDAEGMPIISALKAFVMPGSLGVVYRQGIWHAGARVLDREGSFAVLMWRGSVTDDVHLPIEALLVGPLDGKAMAGGAYG